MTHITPQRRGRAAALVAATALALSSFVATAPVARAADLPAIRTKQTVVSFDGTRINTNFFAAEGLRSGQQAPTVLVGPGWGFSGQTNPDSGTITPVGVIGVGPLRRAGYNVVTWDPRGYGASTGEVWVDNPDKEGRDAMAIIDWVARQPEVKLDAPGDPVVGMAGGSYGGGITYVTAGQDPRVDALAPAISWNSLTTSLYKNGSFKAGWGGLLCGLGTLSGGVNPIGPDYGALSAPVKKACQEGLTTGRISAESEAYFSSVGPHHLMSRVKAPTLLLQGTVDTLFTLDESVRNFRALRAAGTEAKLVWFCGGHGLCSTGYGKDVIETETIQWFGKHLKKQGVDTGKAFSWVDQAGVRRERADLPAPASELQGHTASGAMFLSPVAVSGMAIAAAWAPIAVNVDLPTATTEKLLVGTPKVSFTYRGKALVNTDTHVYVQIIDLANNSLVLGNHATPVAVKLDGQAHRAEVDLEQVAHTLKPGARIRVQITPASKLYAPQPNSTHVDFADVRASVPVID